MVIIGKGGLNMKKGFLGLVIGLIIGLVISSGGIAYASSPPIKLMIDGKEVSPNAPPPKITDDGFYISIRVLVEILGCDFYWDADKNTIFLTHNPNNPSLDIYHPINNPIPNYVRFELYEKLLKVQDARTITLKIMEEGNYDPNKIDIKGHIEYLSNLEKELIRWGTVDEYKEIKAKLLNHVNAMGKSLIYLDNVFKGVNPQYNLINAEKSIINTEYTWDEILAELSSLKIKGQLYQKP